MIAAVLAPSATADERPGESAAYERLATYPVYRNAPPGTDPAAETVAEISSVTRDGRTVIYTDAVQQRIGFVDIRNPSAPRGLGTLSTLNPGDAKGEPTSVAVAGSHALVVVDTSPSFTAPSGRLDVIRIADRERVRSVFLSGQPDSIAVSPDGAYAAIVIENQRDEEFAPTGAEEGDLPQPPGGFLQVVSLAGAPAAWTVTPVPFTTGDGSALPGFAAAGLHEPTDPEPEYVAINSRNRAAVTLQENNGVVIVDLPTRAIISVFSAGTATLTGIDTADDGVIDQTGSIVDTPREPDAVTWLDSRYLATANEGDLNGGTRGWSVFDSRTGAVVWDAGNSDERLAIRHGLHDEARSDNKGTEPEGIAFAVMAGVPTVFVGSERSNFVAAYDVSRPTAPRFRQLLFATNGPEGLLPIPKRNLLVVSSEVDDAEVQIRSTVTVYGLRRGQPVQPSIVSDTRNGVPIGWGALSALSADPRDPHRLYAASDSAYAEALIYRVQVDRKPAVITRSTVVTQAGGAPAELDIEGLYARPAGGFWAVSEGATGSGNALVRLNGTAQVTATVPLPADVAGQVGRWGLEGVTATGEGSGERVVVALQRPLFTDPANATGLVEGDATRIGRYSPATGTWEWFRYPLDEATGGGWVGVSEIAALGKNRYAVIERDNRAGTAAAVKRIHVVTLPTSTQTGPPALLTKRLAVDVLPLLQAPNGWVQEKLEGLTVTEDGRAYAVTDNDGLDDANGETVFLRLGRLR